MPALLLLPIGTRFGRLVVVAEEPPVSRAPHRGVFRMFRLKCDCGGEKITRMNDLRTGVVNSCGCLIGDTNRANSEKTVTHGDARLKRAPEYRVWTGIIFRCSNQKAKSWRYYGGRGIKVCDEWRSDYRAFLRDVGRRPSPELTLDRINNDGNYEPGNVRWATRSQQAYNRRKKGTA